MEANKFNLLTIQQYLEGKLDPKQMHQLEKQALNDPFLADALEGYAHSKKPVEHQLSILQRQLEERIAVQHENKNYFNFTWQRLSIAAAAGLMFITVSILFWMSTQNKNSKMASVPNKVNVELSPELGKTENKTDHEGILKPKEQNKPGSVKSGALASLNAAKSKIPESLPGQVPQSTQITSANPGGRSSSPALNEITAAPNTIALKAPVNTINGKVIDKIAGKPLKGVSVQVKGTGIATETNEKGEFTLPDSLKGTVTVAFLGYKSQELNINSLGNNITLDPESTSLDEVVVTAYGVQAKRSVSSSVSEVRGSVVSGPEPSIGWQLYNEYLVKNMRYPKTELDFTGDVIVGFTVNSKGKPTNIHIVKSLNALCDAEAERLIRQGSDWKVPDPNKSSEAQVAVHFPSISK